ncbi:pimeloyl-ACP methyl ester carboxylesterase [Nocardia tenerifensis]|uniref:Pimeloyl-ACP methyl ester carboxylesterase n=1 Tax=Nocardia tenerifensis TaxID=228006 RepID=A0A318KCL6_9NOCA|nr:alpha/beta fold hydrolase [Nocardia tenerifensis]PXX70675.1 pimeloyl-ACP methyl ester carboxylesterase [Nocardia tenerifensis]
MTNQLDTDTPRPDRQWTVAADGADLAVFEWGDPAATPLVLVHGLTDTHRVWATVAALLTDGFRVIAYDVRGHGRSGSPALLAQFRLDRLADDFYAVIDAASPKQPVHTCGHGWGAVQLWEAVCDSRANTRIASFTAISGPNLDHLGLWLRAVAPHVRLRAGDLGWWLSGVRWTWSPLPVARRLYPPRVRTLLVERLGGLSPVPARIARTWRTDLVAGGRIAQANLLHHLRRPRVRRTAVPVQLLVDSTDPFVPAALYDTSTRWVDRLWRCAVPADHWLPVTEPLLVAEAIANFVDDMRADHASITPRSS